MSRVGWYRLPNGGGYFHGPVPPGAVEVPSPHAAAQAVTVLVAPARSASRAAWEAFAVSFGIDPTGSKAALVERVEQHIEACNSGSDLAAPVTLVDESPAESPEFVDGEPTVDTLDEGSNAAGHED